MEVLLTVGVFTLFLRRMNVAFDKSPDLLDCSTLFENVAYVAW